MSDQKVTFSIFLKDYLSAGMDKISKHGGAAFTKLYAGLSKTTNESKKVALSIDEINHKLDDLKRSRSIKIDIGDVAKINKQIDHLQKQKAKLEGFGTASEGSGSMVGSKGLITKAGIYGAAIAAGYKAGQYLTGSIGAYNEGEQVDAQLAAGLKSTGGISGKTVGGMKLQAQALQDMTLFDDENTKGAQSILLTFTKIRGEIFDKTVPLIQDMATRMKTDLPSAALQAGKALNDPIGGVMALRRVGVQLFDQQEKQIKKFVKLGQVEKAQAIILKELETEFGGSARAAAKAGTGGLTILKNNFGDLKETIGGKLMPTLGSFGTELGKIISRVKEYTEVSMADSLREERTHVEGLVAALQDQNIPAEERNRLYKELISIAPEFSGALQNERIDYQKLNAELITYNSELDKKINRASLQDIANKKLKESSNAQADYINRISEINTVTSRIISSLQIDDKTGVLPYIKKLREQFIGGKIDAYEFGDEVIKLTGDITGNKKYTNQIWADNDYLQSLVYGNKHAITNLWDKNTGLSLPGLSNKGFYARQEQKKAEEDLRKAGGRLDSGGSNKLLNYTGDAGLGSQTSSVSGGGASVKNITINLNSGLIETVNNTFEHGQDPADANDFMTKLTNALQQIVNDVNYA